MEAVGPVLILLSLPLLFRWVPQNRLYGFRVPATLRSTSVWYDLNAIAARHLLILGVALVCLELTLPLSMRAVTLRIVALTGLAAIVAIDWRTANRLEKERARSG